jgi:hypothetical protein
MGYFLVLSLVMRYSKYVVRDILLRDHLLTKRRQCFYFFFHLSLYSISALSYVALLRYHHCTCPYELE